MPEDLVLPGIDSAPAAPAANDAPAPSHDQAAPPSGDDTSTHSASVDTGNETATGDAPTETNEEKAEKRSRGGFQNRINELTARERDAVRRETQLAGLLEMVIKGQMSPQQAQRQDNIAPSEAPPDESKYTDWKAYERDMIRYESRQEIRRELAARAQVEQQSREQQESQIRQRNMEAAQGQLRAVTREQMLGAESEFPDYRDVIESCQVEIPTNVMAAMAITGKAGHVAYYLARNPRVIGQLAQMPDVAVAHHITRIASAMGSSAANVSNAPPVGKPVGNRGTAVNAYPKDATPEQHLAWEAANKRQQGKRA